MNSIHNRQSWKIANPDSPFHTVVLAALVALLCFLSTKLGWALMIRPQMLWPIWPGCAFLVAVLLLAPRRIWPILIVAGQAGFVLYDLQVGLPLRPIVWLNLADTVEILIAALGVSYAFDGLPRLNSVKSLVKYSFVAVLLAPLAAASMTTAAFGGSYWIRWRIGFFTEALALLTLTPAILGWASARQAWAQKSRAFYLEAAMMVAGLGLLGYVAFVAPVRISSPALLFSLLPFLLWSALRFGMTGTSTSMVVVAFLSIWGAVHGRGPFTGSGPVNNVMSLQLFLFFAAAPFMVLSVLVEDQKQTERAFRESEKRFRLVADTAPALIWMSGADKLCTYFNKPWLDFTGRSMEDEIGNGWAEGVHPEDLQRCMGTYAHAFDRREEFRMEYRLRRHDGEYRWVFDIGVPRFGQDRSFIGYIGCAIDVSERKRAEEALRESEGRFHLAAQAGKMFAYEWNAATDVIVRSAEAAQILGIGEAAHITGQQLLAQVHRDDRERLLAALASLSVDKPALQVSYRMVRPDGSVIWVQRDSRAHFDEQGKMLRIIGMVGDITERRRTEESLHLFRKLIDESNDAIEVVDPETLRFLDVNEKACRELGYTRDELLSRRVYDIDPAVDESLLTRRQKELKDLGFVLFDTVHRRKDGSTFPVEINLKSVELDRVYFVNVVRDITERKRTESVLRQKDVELTEAQRIAQVGSWQWDPVNDAVTWSHELYRIAGRDPNLPAVSYAEHSKIYTSESWGRLREAVEETMRSAAPYQLDLEMIRADGTIRWVKARGEAQLDSSGRVVQLRGTVHDITERKFTEAALANTSRKLIEAQEQERTRIARELHDDIGQRLALLAVELQQLHQDPPNLPRVRSRMGELQKQTSQIATDIQTLSHELHSRRLEYLGIAAAMRGFCQEFEEQTKVKIDFKSHDLPSFLSPDISLCLFRVLQEALHNSAKHSGVRQVEVGLWGTPDEIHLKVSDSGAGFDSKAAKEARGLGLTSMEERLKLVKGTLSIESQPMRGTTIRASVPLNLGSDSMRAAG
jgi:PAS domain S-box-containing protein